MSHPHANPYPTQLNQYLPPPQATPTGPGPRNSYPSPPNPYLPPPQVAHTGPGPGLHYPPFDPAHVSLANISSTRFTWPPRIPGSSTRIIFFGGLGFYTISDPFSLWPSPDESGVYMTTDGMAPNITLIPMTPMMRPAEVFRVNSVLATDAMPHNIQAMSISPPYSFFPFTAYRLPE